MQDDAKPVAWMYERECNEVESAATVINITRWSEEQDRGWTETPLYAHPPAPVQPELVERVDRFAAEGLFDKILGDAGSYAEYGRPAYREAAVRTLTESLECHRLLGIEQGRAEMREEAAGIAEDRYPRRNALRVCGVNIASDIRAIPTAKERGE